MHKKILLIAVVALVLTGTFFFPQAAFASPSCVATASDELYFGVLPPDHENSININIANTSTEGEDITQIYIYEPWDYQYPPGFEGGGAFEYFSFLDDLNPNWASDPYVLADPSYSQSQTLTGADDYDYDEWPEFPDYDDVIEESSSENFVIPVSVTAELPTGAKDVEVRAIINDTGSAWSPEIICTGTSTVEFLTYTGGGGGEEPPYIQDGLNKGFAQKTGIMISLAVGAYIVWLLRFRNPKH